MLTIAKESELPALDFATIASLTTILHKTINKICNISPNQPLAANHMESETWWQTRRGGRRHPATSPVSGSGTQWVRRIHTSIAMHPVSPQHNTNNMVPSRRRHRRTNRHTPSGFFTTGILKGSSKPGKENSLSNSFYFLPVGLQSHKKDEGRFVCEQVSRSGSGCVSAGWTLRCSWIDLD